MSGKKHSDHEDVFSLVLAIQTMADEGMKDDNLCPKCLYGTLTMSMISTLICKGYAGEEELFDLISTISRMSSDRVEMRNNYILSTMGDSKKMN